VREGRDVDDLVGAADLVIIDATPHAEAYVRITARAARLVAVPVQPSPLRSVGDRQVRSGLPAGGRWIRTLGPPARESSVVAPCTRRAVSLRGLVAHPTVEQHAQRGDEGERLV
jgi:hypothetical protein